MQVRFSTDPAGFRSMTTEELRKSFLIDGLFVPDEIPMVYSDINRSITRSAVPVKGALKLLGTKKEMAAEYSAECREIGVINTGGDGTIVIDGKEYSMTLKDALYIGRGAQTIEFSSKSPDKPAMFYFVSYPAHKGLPTTHAKFTDAEPSRLGSQKDANKRTIYKYHPHERHQELPAGDGFDGAGRGKRVEYHALRTRTREDPRSICISTSNPGR